ncbi:hypothetical protein ILUMI_14442 [Ignelater luminosus]|uniref:Uncharacterized protein n=1 Tax=Ignelater luminosus TaxID=2038154 RepID=A0A8K0CYM9_IGNLU|nr:hypothetical protein ILUMI_14442 [Ignelater luminosus]
MPRSKRGTKRIISTEQAMKAAVQDILETHMSLKVARDKHNTLIDFSYDPKLDIHRLFSSEEKQELADYLKPVAHFHYGLTTYQTRKLAYDYAETNGKNLPI